MKNGLTQRNVDPCMFYSKKNGKLMLMVILDVDSIIVSGSINEVNELKREFGRFFIITDEGVMKQHLGVSYEWVKDEKGKWLDATMNEMANSIIKDYEK